MEVSSGDTPKLGRPFRESNPRAAVCRIYRPAPCLAALNPRAGILGKPKKADDGLQASADAGLTYLVTPELQLDVHVVRSLRGPDATAVGVGVVRRF